MAVHRTRCSGCVLQAVQDALKAIVKLREENAALRAENERLRQGVRGRGSGRSSQKRKVRISQGSPVPVGALEGPARADDVDPLRRGGMQRAIEDVMAESSDVERGVDGERGGDIDDIRKGGLKRALEDVMAESSDEERGEVEEGGVGVAEPGEPRSLFADHVIENDFAVEDGLAKGEDEEARAELATANGNTPSKPGGDSAALSGSSPSAVARELYLRLGADDQSSSLLDLVKEGHQASLHSSALRIQQLRASAGGLFVYRVLDLLRTTTISTIARRVRASSLSPFDRHSDTDIFSAEGTAKDFYCACFISTCAARLVQCPSSSLPGKHL